jgi:hypothetical protein
MTIDLAAPIKDSRETIQRSRDLRAWHSSLVGRCHRTVAGALEMCEVSFSLREGEDDAPLPLRYIFYIRGQVGDCARLAIWRDRQLLVHPELARRAELLVGSGEIFEAPELGAPILAGLDEPLQAALTLMRAADRILEFDIRLNELYLTYQHRDGNGAAIGL